MQTYFTVYVGRKFRDSNWYPLYRGCPLNMGFSAGFTVSVTTKNCTKIKFTIN